MPPPAPPAPPTSPPNVSPRAPEVAPREIINILETNVADVGEWGGTCTCPNGNVYNVGDNNDGCGSLACIGGIPGVCGQNNPGGAYRRVTCGVGPPFPPPSPPPPPLPPPLPPPSPPTPDNCPVCMECDNANNLQDEVQEESCPDGLGGSSCQVSNRLASRSHVAEYPVRIFSCYGCTTSRNVLTAEPSALDVYIHRRLRGTIWRSNVWRTRRRYMYPWSPSVALGRPTARIRLRNSGLGVSLSLLCDPPRRMARWERHW